MRFVVAALFSIAGILAVGQLVRSHSKPVLPSYSQVPAFRLTDSSGQEFDSSQLNSKVWIAHFFFSSCPHICPTVTGKVAELKAKLKAASDVKIVSISIDPLTDTPAVLAKYAARFPTANSNWYFLTGPQEVIDNLLREVFYLGSLSDKNNHSTRLALIDKSGVVRGYYNTQDSENMSKLIEDTDSLL